MYLTSLYNYESYHVSLLGVFEEILWNVKLEKFKSGKMFSGHFPGTSSSPLISHFMNVLPSNTIYKLCTFFIVPWVFNPWNRHSLFGGFTPFRLLFSLKPSTSCPRWAPLELWQCVSESLSFCIKDLTTGLVGVHRTAAISLTSSLKSPSQTKPWHHKMSLFVWDQEQILSFSITFVSSVHKTLSQIFWRKFQPDRPIFLVNESFASSAEALWLWGLQSCPLQVAADVTNRLWVIFHLLSTSQLLVFLPQTAAPPTVNTVCTGVLFKSSMQRDTPVSHMWAGSDKRCNLLKRLSDQDVNTRKQKLRCWSYDLWPHVHLLMSKPNTEGKFISTQCTQEVSDSSRLLGLNTQHSNCVSSRWKLNHHKGSKDSAKHWARLKSPGVNKPHLNVSHFQECFSSASTNSDEETVWLRGRPQIMQSVFLSSRPLTQKCLHTVAETQVSSESYTR